MYTSLWTTYTVVYRNDSFCTLFKTGAILFICVYVPKTRQNSIIYYRLLRHKYLTLRIKTSLLLVNLNTSIVSHHFTYKWVSAIVTTLHGKGAKDGSWREWRTFLWCDELRGQVLHFWKGKCLLVCWHNFEKNLSQFACLCVESMVSSPKATISFRHLIGKSLTYSDSRFNLI